MSQKSHVHGKHLTQNYQSHDALDDELQRNYTWHVDIVVEAECFCGTLQSLTGSLYRSVPAMIYASVSMPYKCTDSQWLTTVSTHPRLIQNMTTRYDTTLV